MSMSISDLYPSGKHKQEIGHFASVVKIATTDGVITEKEQQLLDKIAQKLHIKPSEYTAILANPEKYPVNPPVSYDQRIERLYRLTKMLYADENIDKKEVSLLQKIAVGLHFSNDNVKKICDQAISLVMNDNDLEDFTLAIKKVNAI